MIPAGCIVGFAAVHFCFGFPCILSASSTFLFDNFTAYTAGFLKIKEKNIGLSNDYMHGR